jgi:hypothetical protein
MNNELYIMLETTCLAEIAKAKLSLSLLGKTPVGIGDHSTGDFYTSAREALSKLAEYQDMLNTLQAKYPQVVSL